jgi:Zn-dependent peptidase ImmA (M78 family)
MTADTQAWTKDREANAFAMELLMPEAWLRRDVSAMGGIDIDDEKTVAKLAKKYRVSAGVMTLRLGELSAKARGESP